MTIVSLTVQAYTHDRTLLSYIASR